MCKSRAGDLLWWRTPEAALQTAKLSAEEEEEEGATRNSWDRLAIFGRLCHAWIRAQTFISFHGNPSWEGSDASAKTAEQGLLKIPVALCTPTSAGACSPRDGSTGRRAAAFPDGRCTSEDSSISLETHRWGRALHDGCCEVFSRMQVQDFCPGAGIAWCQGEEGGLNNNHRQRTQKGKYLQAGRMR